MSFLDFLGPIGKAIDTGLNFVNAKEQRESNEQIARENIANQKEFAQQGIRWKVADAQAAGLHPLAALGAQTSSFSNVVGNTADLPTSSFGEMGQDIGRAMKAGQTSDERGETVANAASKVAQTFQLENMSLQNEKLKTDIAKERAQLGPPLPASALAHLSRSPTRTVSGHATSDDKIEQKPEDFPATAIGRPFGYALRNNPYFGDGQSSEDRYGDSEILSTIKAAINLAADHGYTAWKDWIPTMAEYYGSTYRNQDRSRYSRAQRNMRGR